MTEPAEMSLARNIYARERERFRRELLFAFRAYEGRPITFEIKQHLGFRAADLRRDCLEAYRKATKNIDNNQGPLLGNSLRVRSMVSTDVPQSNSRLLLQDDEELSKRIRSSIPLSRYTYDRSRMVNTNTHVSAFEQQLKDDLDRVIRSIDDLTDRNRDEWLRIPKGDVNQYFSSRYDDTGYSLQSFTGGSSSINFGNSSKFGNFEKYAPRVANTPTAVELFYEKYLTTKQSLAPLAAATKQTSATTLFGGNL